MYIFELLYKLINKQKTDPQEPLDEPAIDSEVPNEPEEKCEHMFLPIDSTKKILACSKCGYILKVKDNPKKNFFIN